MEESSEKKWLGDNRISPDVLFESVIIEAQDVPGNSTEFETGLEIPWLDIDLAQSGQFFFQKHYFSILFGHALYHGLSFGFKSISGVVLKTGGFKGIEQTTRRVLSTLWHVLSWYESDIVGCYAPGTKKVAFIRHTHDVVRRKCYRQLERGVDFDVEETNEVESWTDPLLQALQKDLKLLNMKTFERLELTYNPPVPMSQFDMVMMQLVFVYPVFAHPEAFGIVDDEDAEGFEHLWALIGRLSGIDDKYNIPLHRPGKEFYRRFWENVFVPSILVRDAKICLVQESFFKTSGGYMPQMSIPATHYLFLKRSNLTGFVGSEMYKLMNWTDVGFIFLVRILLALVAWSTVVRNLANKFTRILMKRILDKFAKEEEAEGRQFTSLPKDTPWSTKYRKRDPDVLHRWKKTESILDIMRPTKKPKSSMSHKLKS